MVRSRPTATTDDNGASLTKGEGIIRKIVGCGGVHNALVDALRPSSVGHHRETCIGCLLAHLVNHTQQLCRTARAIGTNDIGATLDKFIGRACRVVAEQGSVVAGERDRGDHGMVGHFSGCLNRQARFMQVTLRFDDEDIHASSDERLDLLAICVESLFRFDTPKRRQADAKWANASSDENVFARSVDHTTCKLGGGCVDLVKTGFQAVNCQLIAVSAE